MRGSVGLAPLDPPYVNPGAHALPPDERDSQTPRSFTERLGVRADEEGRLVLEVGPAHLRSLGIAHGGMIATLLDSAMGLEVSRSAPPDHYVVTAQLNVNFIRPAWEGETLVASTRVRHSGGKTAVAQGDLATTSGALVATASGMFVYVRHTDATRSRPDRLEPAQPGT